MNNILQMQQWSVKGIKQAESMMCEAKARIVIWQKRTKSLRSDQEPGMMIVILAQAILAQEQFGVKLLLRNKFCVALVI